MDQSAPQSSNIIKTGPGNSIKIIISFLTLFLGLVIGIFSSPYILPQKDINNPAQSSNRSFTQEKQVKESELPIGIDILKNPMVTQWRGSVDGKLTSKDAKNITISDTKGNSIIIMTDAEFTHFLTKINGKLTEVSVNEIPLGSRLVGEFFTIPEPSNKNKVIGGIFKTLE